MLSKEEFLKKFNKEDKELAIKIYNNIMVSCNKDITMFSKFFLPPNIWNALKDENLNVSIPIDSDGAFDDGDRRMLSFNNIYDIEYPYKCLQIKNMSKFSTLLHRDYLGALMSLGIEREKIGDLRVEYQSAYVPVYEDLADYIIASLKEVKNSPVEIKVIPKSKLPKSNTEEIIINISSQRIDNYVSKLANVSRSKALELIQSGKVLVDYSKSKDKSQEITVNQTITISGVGKFITGEIVGYTKSRKSKVSIKKYL